MKLFIFIILSTVLVKGRDIMNYFPTCQNEQDIETCLLKALDSIRPRLKYGIREMSLPPLDPYTLDYLDIDTNLTNIKIKCVATDILVYGASDYRIPYFRVDNRTFSFEMKIVVPYLSISSDFDTQGTRVFFVTLNGQGKFKGIFDGVTLIIRGLMRPVESDGMETLKIDTLTTEIKFSDTELVIKPLAQSFSARAAAAYINTRPEVIMENLAPKIDEYIAPHLKDYLNNLLDVISKDRLLIYKQ